MKNNKIFLKKNEQITLTKKNIEYDIVRKNWGFYVTPSFQNRLKRFGLEVILINSKKDYYICIVEIKKKKNFKQFLKKNSYTKTVSLTNTKSYKKFFNNK